MLGRKHSRCGVIGRLLLHSSRLLHKVGTAVWRLSVRLSPPAPAAPARPEPEQAPKAEVDVDALIMMMVLHRGQALAHTRKVDRQIDQAHGAAIMRVVLAGAAPLT